MPPKKRKTQLSVARATIKPPEPGLTGLQRRLKAFTAEKDSTISSTVDESIILPVGFLHTIGEKLQCSSCGDTGAVANIEPEKLSPQILFTCNACSAVICSAPGTQVASLDGKERNLDGKQICLVHDSLMNGGGFFGFRDTSIRLGISGLCSSMYYRYSSFLQKQMDGFYEEMRVKMRKGLNSIYKDLHPANLRSEDGILNVDVSFDGTWMTRGHKSHIGVGYVMDSDTGSVLDCQVLSNYCQMCLVKQKSLSPEKFAVWKVSHNSCTKNFEGKSGAMESEAAVRLWSRSEAIGFRYVSFICDGDSSAFRAVAALNNGKGPYDSCKVVKEECINHFAKRLYSRLMALKKSLRVPVVTKTGKTQMRSVLAGKLKDSDILALQNHLQHNLWKQGPTDSVQDL